MSSLLGLLLVQDCRLGAAPVVGRVPASNLLTGIPGKEPPDVFVRELSPEDCGDVILDMKSFNGVGSETTGTLGSRIFGQGDEGGDLIVSLDEKLYVH